ncbi:MAG TPA: hypothetical protein VFD07_05005 [Candidatus Krumholzibacteria bacterium]|nr:hypothetical protein [Candidatus Krumholzibacteria bacterium]
MEFLVSCRECGRSYARFLLPDADARCRCGAALASPPPSLAPESSPVESEALHREEAALQELRRLADRVSFLIVATDMPRVDVDIHRIELRRRCQELFPDKMDVFDLVYESRFARLWQQFRAA